MAEHVGERFCHQQPGHTGQSKTNTTNEPLRAFSLIAWGLPVAPKCTERAVKIANAISSDYELVVLQEIWHMRERHLIIFKAQEIGFYYYHYIIRPGCGIPIPNGGGVVCRTFVGNKGVGLLRIETPAGQIDVYVMHLLVNYNIRGKPGIGDFYQLHQTDQSYELTQFITATNKNRLTIVCGDFNSSPDCLVLKIPRQLLCLRDAFTDASNDMDGLAFASPENKFSHRDHPMRMDYVMYKIAKQPKNKSAWHLVKSSIFKGFFIDAQGEKTPLSDHFGVSAEFTFSEPRAHSCKQLDGFDVVTTNIVESLGVTIERSCPSTKCSHCDAIEREQSEEDKFTADATCLQELQNTLFAGRNQAMLTRQIRLRRAVAFFVADLAVFMTHVMSIVVSSWSWVVVLLFGMISVTEYILTFYFLTFECTTFIELTIAALPSIAYSIYQRKSK
ncbi:unnamed protein product [Peronospora farinosa]|uniref:Endonuclease/exonuclease/phosphatase domain-containing protein n=1 Tax=Peronospora farinosa TaxID=134698 RepID=A0ABN8BZR7_9STRA|nr:unnamed protein product [Peronospora farinosa]